MLTMTKEEVTCCSEVQHEGKEAEGNPRSVDGDC